MGSVTGQRKGYGWGVFFLLVCAHVVCLNLLLENCCCLCSVSFLLFYPPYASHNFHIPSPRGSRPTSSQLNQLHLTYIGSLTFCCSVVILTLYPTTCFRFDASVCLLVSTLRFVGFFWTIFWTIDCFAD